VKEDYRINISGTSWYGDENQFKNTHWHVCGLESSESILQYSITTTDLTYIIKERLHRTTDDVGFQCQPEIC